MMCAVNPTVDTTICNLDHHCHCQQDLEIHLLNLVSRWTDLNFMDSGDVQYQTDATAGQDALNSRRVKLIDGLT